MLKCLGHDHVAKSKSLLEWSQKSMPEIDLGLEVVVLILMIREWWLSQRLL